MKASKWPFRPVHITNDGENSKDPDLQRLTGEGIISNAHLQGLQTQICASLKNPTTIVEFSPDGEPVRTDSSLLYFAMHPPCRIFRECSQHRWCLRRDNRQALLFSGLGGKPKVVLQELEDRISQSCVIRGYSRNEDLEFSLEQLRDRPFFAYDCPLLGYRELLFPIFFERHVLATFFVGQLCLKRKLDLIVRRQAQLFRQGADYFSEFLAENPTSSVASIGQDVSAAHSKWIADPDHVFTDTRYEEFIERTCSELHWLEKTLAEQMKLQRGLYVTHRMDKRIRAFRHDLVMGAVDAEQKRSLLWKNVENQLTHILSDFAIRYFVVFAGSGLRGRHVPFLEVVAKSENLPHELLRAVEAGELRFNVGKVPETARNHWSTSIQDEGIIDAIEGWMGFSRKLNLVRMFPVPLFPQASMVVLVGYHDRHSLAAAEHKAGEHLSAALQSFYTVVLSALSAVLAASAEAKMETALRIFGHETGQLTAGLDWLRALYLSDPETLRELPDQKSDDICRDIEGFMSQLLFLSKQARMLLEVERPRKTFFFPYKELLFKWKDIYRLEAVKKDLQFDILVPDRDDPYRPKMWGGLKLLEQLVYNLVNNAVKYCYRGTRIHLDCRKADTQRGTPHILTVTNYGMKADGTESLYDLYGRGANTGDIEGLGIGLFIVKRIAVAHGGGVTHLCEKVSEYNVPLLEPYLRAQLQWKHSDFMRSLKREVDKLMRDGNYYEIVALGENKEPRYLSPTREEMVNSIKKSTWKTTFTVTIPPLEK